MGTTHPLERPHGTRPKYVREHCRCEPCTAANAAYHRGRNRARSRPDATWAPRVAADEAAHLIAELRAAGAGLRHISELSGVSRATLAAISTGRRTHTTPATITALRRLHPAGADGTYVDATPTKAALEALTNAGWSSAQLAAITGRGAPYRVRGSRVRRCTEHQILTAARSVGAMFDDDWNTVITPAPPASVGL